MKKYQKKCEECGAFYTCKWCGGTWWVESGLGPMCVSCGALSSSGNADFNHDYSKHRVKHECRICGKGFYSYVAYSNHMLNEHGMER